MLKKALNSLKSAKDTLKISMAKGGKTLDKIAMSKGGDLKESALPKVLYHYTNDKLPIISTHKDRLVPNSLSTSANKKDWSKFGKNLFEITLPENAKMMVIDNSNFFKYGKEEDTPLNRGKEIYKEAKKNKIDVIYFKKVVQGKDEYVVLNKDFKYKKINTPEQDAILDFKKRVKLQSELLRAASLAKMSKKMEKGGKTLAQTPAPKKDRIHGSNINKVGSAKDGKNVKLSKETLNTIKNKLSKFKEDNPNKTNITLNDLKAVYRRGSGAYSTSHRPTISGGAPNSRAAWSIARVNKFLKKASGEKVKKAYVQDDDLMKRGGLIAPNGKPSNLTPEQYRLVRTPEFKAWFGDWENDPQNASKVVDENGEPMIVYHGTTKDFNIFTKNNIGTNDYGFFGEGFYFGSISIAKTYSQTSDWNEINDTVNPNGRVLSCFLNVRNPLIDSSKNIIQSKETSKDFTQNVIKNFDGVIAIPYQRFSPNTEYIVFESNQIKLADGTNTNFDTNNPDIRFNKGGLIAPNGKQSKLTPNQYKLVRTPEFKAWFGDWENDPQNASKVVDENGEPMIVYHGTTKDFNIFTKNNIGTNDYGFFGEGFYFGSISIAKTYSQTSDWNEINDTVNPNGRVLSCFLNVRNPLIDSSKNIIQSKETSKDFTQNVIKNFDGVIAIPYQRFSPNTEYIVFESNQIKLADGTNTTFDMNNLDIRYKDGGDVDTKYNDILIWHEKEGNWLVPKNQIYAWLYKDPKAGEKLRNKEYDFVLFPPTPPIGAAYQKGFVPPLLRIWTKEYSKTHKGVNDLIGIVKAYYDENEKKLYVEMMTTRKEMRRKGVNSHIIKQLRDELGLEKDQIEFVDTTKEGESFKKSSKYEDGGKMDVETTIFIPPTLQTIAKEHGVGMAFVNEQYELGTKEELEHTPDIELAQAIALHHLNENPNYYIILKKAFEEEEANKLDGYYAKGGAISCEQLDENGERKIDMDSINTLTHCVMNLPQTKSMHFDYTTNRYTPERHRLHKDIIYNIKKDVVCIENDQPIAILMGGSPASGKSTFLKKYSPYLLNEEILKIDADEIRSKLPEYKGYNATQTHLETKDIVNTLLSDRNIGLPCKFDVIYDGTMNSTKSYIPLITLLKELGYKVFIVYIDKVQKDVIVKRALERYKKSGRFVPLEVIDDFFDKGTSAMEQLKFMVDGYMIIDGSNTDYKILSQGGMRLPKKRNYSKIGQPIQITEDEIITEFKKGGELDPDNPSIKNEITHKSGSAGGMLVGNRHSEGGIKAINKSTNQPLEMEGGEVVITRNAVSDDQKREFEGEMLTNREILSKINEGGGGVSFAKGGDVPQYIMTSGKEYKYGGKTMKDSDIVSSCGCQHKMKEGGISDYEGNLINLEVGDIVVEYKKPNANQPKREMGGQGKIILISNAMAKVEYNNNYEEWIPLKDLKKVGDKMKEGGYMDDGITTHEYMHLKYGHKLQREGDLLIMNKAVPSFISFSKYNQIVPQGQLKETYKGLLKREYEINFDELPHAIKGALMIGNQKMIDNYINN